MNVAGLASATAAALLLCVALLAAGGLCALPSLPSDIYPPLQFPRVIVIAHVRHAARPHR